VIDLGGETTIIVLFVQYLYTFIMEIENLINKYVKLSEEKKAIFLYDNTCKLCINATNFASKILKKRNIDSMLYGIKKEFKREVLKSDQFMFFYDGVQYIGHYAWIKIFSLAGFPWNLCRYFSKSKMCIRFAEISYNFVSKYRKKWKKCDCD